MSSFEYVVVLLAIIIGLGMTELLSNVARLIRHAATVKFHWIPLALSAFIFIGFLQMWREAWDLHAVERWSMLSLAHMLAAPIGLYIMSHLIFPDRIEAADLLAHYLKISRPFWLILAASVLVAALYWPVSQGAPLSLAENISTLILVAGACVLAFSRSIFVHACAVAVMGVAVLADIALFSWRLTA